MRPSVLFVDDDPVVLHRFRIQFRKQFAITVAQNPLAAIDLLKNGMRYDVIVSDIMMPGMNGMEFLAHAKTLSPFSTRIALTGHADLELVAETVNQGHVYKFLTKPCKTERLGAAIADAANYAMQRQYNDDDFSQNLLAALSFRNLETSRHVERVGYVSSLLARALGRNEDDIRMLRAAAPLHDIGKIGIPDAILLKPGSLSDEEYAIMKKHSRIGAEMLQRASTPLLSMARDIAWGHHERPDGTGYPHGLVGTEIPWSARIVSVADVYDALVSDRVYRGAFSHEEAQAVIRGGRGTEFDSHVVDAFFGSIPQIKSLYDPGICP